MVAIKGGEFPIYYSIFSTEKKEKLHKKYKEVRSNKLDDL